MISARPTGHSVKEFANVLIVRSEAYNVSKFADRESAEFFDHELGASVSVVAGVWPSKQVFVMP